MPLGNVGRQGTTLLEVVIAMGIFVTVLVGIMQGLIATRNYVGEDEIRNDLELESLRILNEFSGDLGNSAWFLREPIIFPSNNHPQPMLSSPVTYPNVGKGIANLGTTPWGDQIDFVKLRLKNGTAISPFLLRQYSGRINLTGSGAIKLDDFINARSVSNLIVNDKWVSGGDESIPYVWPVFESAVPNLTFEQNSTFANPARSPRLYRYTVRAIPGSTTGRMVRQYSNGPGLNYNNIGEYPKTLSNSSGYIVPPPIGASSNPWVDDIILTDNIKATEDKRFPLLVGTPGLRFDTILTDPTLGQNQVRITVMLVREPSASNSGIVVRRVVQTSVAMRSITFD